MEYTIKYWATDEERDIGESDVHFPAEDIDPADKEAMVNAAKNLFYRNDFPAVELENELGETVYHISVDVPEGQYE